MKWIPDWLRHPFSHIVDAPPGERFVRHYERRHSKGAEHPLLRYVLLALGMLLATLGLAMMFTPGPGLIVTTVGLALISARSRVIASWLDRGEMAVRARIPARTRK